MPIITVKPPLNVEQKFDNVTVVHDVLLALGALQALGLDESDDAVKAARKELGLLSAKPVIYACNVGEDDLLGGLDENPYFPLVAARAKEENAQAIPICAKTEEDIAGSTQEEKIAFLQEMGIESTGLDKLIKASYELLGLISFLTDGKKECRAWTIRKGTKAPQAAGKIHSDFERGFIRAEGVVGRLRVLGAGQRIEQGRLAHVGQTHNA